MKALLRKDFYQLTTQFKIFFVMMVIFCAIPKGNTVFFGVIYSTLMTSTTLLTMDEANKWDALALMLPYSKREIVVEKYVMGWMCLAGVLVFAVAAQALWSVAGVIDPVGWDYVSILLVYAAVALLIQAVMTPINFRFGFTRGRLMTILFLAVVGAIVGGASVISSAGQAMSLVQALTRHIHIATYPLLAAALSVATIPLSVRGYGKRMEK